MSAPDLRERFGRSTAIAAPRLLGTWPRRVFTILFVAAIFALPLNTSDKYLLTVLTAAGITAIAAQGLNLLTGYAGQISLGHAFFVGIGAFAAQYFGGNLGLPIYLWLPLAAISAGAIGGLVAPIALRLKGPYLAIVSLGLVYVGIYAARNLQFITGGMNGTSFSASTTIGPIDLARLQIGPFLLSRQQSLFIVVWLILAVVLVVVANIVRSRSGRAMQAVRDDALAAEVMGVRLLPTLANAFIASSVLAGLAGGLLAMSLQYIRPENFGIPLSIEYVAVIVIGGMATIWGPVVGALFVSLVPVVTLLLAQYVPFIAEPGETRGISTTDFGLIAYGVLIVVFLLFRPGGIMSLFSARIFQRRSSFRNHTERGKSS